MFRQFWTFTETRSNVSTLETQYNYTETNKLKSAYKWGRVSVRNRRRLGHTLLKVMHSWREIHAYDDSML